MTEARPPVVVLGPYPNYTELAAQIGAEVFAIAADLWQTLSEAERWEANRIFLDSASERGTVFRLAIPPDEALAGSYYAQELDYLISQGFRVRFATTHWELFR